MRFPSCCISLRRVSGGTAATADSAFAAYPSRLGYYAVGTHLLALAKWLLCRCRADGVKRLVFLARDGALLRQAVELLRNIPFEDMVFAGENALDLRTLVRDQSAEAALAAHEMGAADAPSRMIGFIPEQTGLVKRTIGFLLFDRETFRKKLRKRMHRSQK